MSILQEATQAEINEESKENLLDDLELNSSDPAENNNFNSNSFKGFDFSFLKIPTGAGSVDDYLEHVLNAEHSKGMAQILRGFTGIAGNLNLAILDIILGIFAYIKENKHVQKNVQEQKPINERPIISA